MFAILKRLSDNDRQTLGILSIFNELGELVFKCDTLELSWKDNQDNISCIPLGDYEVETTFSFKYKKDMYQIMNVPDRDGIRIHSGNYRTDIKGCILVGKGYKDINSDGDVDIVNSKDTLKNLRVVLGDKFKLKII